MEETKKVKVESVCSPCGGTGIYQGFAEPKGVGVVCIECGGTGKKVIEYTPFVKRRRRKDIKQVRLSKGRLIAVGVGPTGSEVSYEEFLAGKFPQPVS